MKKLLFLTSIIILLISCNNDEYEYLGCDWSMPSEAYDRGGDSFALNFEDPWDFSSFNYQDDYVPELMQDLLDLDMVYKDGVLDVNEYSTNSTTSFEGIKYFVITREGFSGSIGVMDYDYKILLTTCR